MKPFRNQILLCQPADLSSIPLLCFWCVLEKLDFSGYEWLVRETPVNRAGSLNRYERTNASIDQKGFLHLRILKTPAAWTGAEVNLTPSFGYGSYRFLVSNVAHLEPFGCSGHFLVGRFRPGS
jgi:hypothetical protein